MGISICYLYGPCLALVIIRQDSLGCPILDKGLPFEHGKAIYGELGITLIALLKAPQTSKDINYSKTQVCI